MISPSISAQFILFLVRQLYIRYSNGVVIIYYKPLSDSVRDFEQQQDAIVG